MSERQIIMILLGVVIVLFLIVLVRQFVYSRATRHQLEKASLKLVEIMETGNDEELMIFTENRALMELAAQINALLADRQKIKIDYLKERRSSKRMLSNISHDVKTPLTVILGYLEIARLNNTEDESLKKVEAQAKQVMDLIDQFFTLAKLEAGDTDMSLSKLELGELCRENVLSFYELLQQKGFAVEIMIPESPFYVMGNRDAIQRIMANLISNAIRYGCYGGYLGITLRADESFIYLDVTDRGKGIAKEFADHIFERLYTLEDSRNRSIQGNGLGLTIAKNLADQLEGDILFESEPYVRTTFTLRLKKALY